MTLKKNVREIESVALNGFTTGVKAAIAHLTEYRQALITSAVTGQIDVRERAA